MVIKGGARGGPVALAAHLGRTDTNERVTLRELYGVTAKDIRGALREMDTMAAAAESRRTLYHANIDTRQGEEMTEAQKAIAVERLAARLGLTDQARVVVEHVKKGREHLHVVFLRIALDDMTAISDSHNYRKHEEVARDLEHEFGHERVQGAHVERQGRLRPKRTPSHPEMQQADRSGLTPDEATARITELWNRADNGRAFGAALENDGWILARGDRRDFVIIDRAGETHSLAKRIHGVRAAQVRERMADIDPASLPSAGEAREIQRNRGKAHSQVEQLPAAATRTLRMEPEIIVLKVEPSSSTATNRPLEVAPEPLHEVQPELPEQAARIVARHMPEAPQRASMEGENSHPTPKLDKFEEIGQRAAPAMFRQLYTAAAEITHRVLDKARHLFERQPALEQKPDPRQVLHEQDVLRTPEPLPMPEPSGQQPEKTCEPVVDRLILDLIKRGREVRLRKPTTLLREELERKRKRGRSGPEPN